MEPIDEASRRFDKLLDEVTQQGYWDSILSEADTRMKIIDRVFTDILGWKMGDVHLEGSAGKSFIDYRFTINGLSRLIVEAKKEMRDLGVHREHAARFFKLNGAVFKTEAAQEGIEQAINYCGHKNAELACVTNGRQWVIFRGARGADGTNTLDGQACVFGSLESVQQHFQEFYELLSHDSIAVFTYRAIFREKEGQPIRQKSSKTVARSADSRVMLKADLLSHDLDRIMQSFFRDLSGDDDGEARRACFVTTSESAAAEQGLARISEELRDKVRSLNSETSELTEAIKRVQELKKNELALLVGTKGAGKTTFIERFFADVLPKAIRNDCIIVRVDLSKSGSNAATVIRWLDEHFLETAESAAFPRGAPSYEEIQGMFFSEYKRWSEGHARHLYETNKTQFKIDFGRHIETLRRDRPHKYITHLLFRIVQAHAKVPCLVFDNADHFDVPFQEEVFKYAHSLCLESVSLVIVPITDTTSWQLAKQGPIQSFYTDSFFLPTPPTELVLRRRIEYIEKRTAEEKPEVGKGYFFTKGIQLEIGNIRAFAACLQTVFLNTGQVADWIGRLANHDIRRSLQLTREIVASPHVRVADLLKAYVAKDTLSIDVDDIKMAIIRGKYDIYCHTVQSFVQNVYDVTPEFETTPLLSLRILSLLESAWEGNSENESRYVFVDEIGEYFHAMNIEPRVTRACLDTMLKRGLCLSYDPTTDGIVGTVKIEIAPSGKQHLAWSQRDWAYMESMAEVTPMYDSESCETIRANLKTGAPHLRRAAIRDFLQYLLAEDSHFCSIPKHELYSKQGRIQETLTQQITLLMGAAAVRPSSRYHRLFGKITAWKVDRGFGFIRIGGDAPDVFVHINDILNAEEHINPDGMMVEFEAVAVPQGTKAIQVVILEQPG